MNIVMMSVKSIIMLNLVEWWWLTCWVDRLCGRVRTDRSMAYTKRRASLLHLDWSFGTRKVPAGWIQIFPLQLVSKLSTALYRCGTPAGLLLAWLRLARFELHRPPLSHEKLLFRWTCYACHGHGATNLSAEVDGNECGRMPLSEELLRQKCLAGKVRSLDRCGASENR